MNSHSPESQRKLMVIGCGHSQPLLSSCGHPHPANQFITVDMNPDRKPDILLNISNVDLLRRTVHERFAPISTVIFEYCPLPEKTTLTQFKELLDDNGYLILIGVGISIFDQLDIGHQLWFGQDHNAVAPRNAVIIPKSPDHPSTMPTLDPAVTKYLCSVLRAKDEEQLTALFTPANISAEYKSIMPKYRQYVDRSYVDPSAGFIPCMARNEELFLLLTKELNIPPTKSEIMNIIHSYTPGFFRRTFNDGKTDDMANLLRCLESKNDPLSDDDLREIADLVAKRQQAGSAVLKKLFWSPDNTETTRVFAAVYARIHMYQFACNALQELQYQLPANK